MGEERVLSHNLRKTRQGLLFSEHYRNEDYEKLLESFGATLRSASRGSKQLLFLADGELRLNRFSALKELPKHFPEVDVSFRSPDELMDVWIFPELFFEEVIRSYIKKFPRNST